MNKNIGISILVLVVILISGGIYVSKNLQNNTNISKDETMRKDGDTMMKDENAMTDSIIKDSGDMMVKDEKITNDSMTKDGEMMDNGKDKIMMYSGSYRAYSQDRLALADNGDIVLFFRASWCPTCRALDSDIKTNAQKIPVGVTILDVDYDNSTELKQKYGVTYQHTLVQVDSSGKMIAKWAGSPTLESLVAEIK